MTTPIHRYALETNNTLATYSIKHVLGQGGFGITYLAWDLNLHRQVAIKEYLPIELAVREHDHSVQPASSPLMEKYEWGLSKFLEEARMLTRFDHPNIIRVYSFFEANNTGYIVMRYEEGKSLQEYLSIHHTMEESNILSFLIPIVGGLEKVHEKGFLHRDIKPANIYLRNDGSPVLLDFGAARQALFGTTKYLTAIATPGYSAIEQYSSNKSDQSCSTDIYGLAATCYRCITGFKPKDSVDRSRAISTNNPDPLILASVIAHERYSSRFLDAIDSALKISATDRPKSLADFIGRMGLTDDLQTTIVACHESGASPNIARRTTTFIRKHKYIITTCAFLILMALLVALLMPQKWTISNAIDLWPDIQFSEGDASVTKSVWASDYGVVVLNLNTSQYVKGTYRSYGDNGVNGDIRGRLIDDELHGTWVQSHVSSVPCAQSIGASPNWGRLLLRFNSDHTAFEGKWGYCGDGRLVESWNGERQ